MAGKVQPGRRRHPGAPEEPSLFIKYTLFFVNVIFWIAGALILAIGIYIMVEMKDAYQKLADLSFQPAVIFLLLGGLVFIITFLGCIGALRENTCLLCAYIGLVTLILTALIACAALGFYFKDPVQEKVTAKLKDAIVLYRDPKKQDLQLIMDTVQTELKCCGVTDYNDWDANLYFNCSGPSREKCGVPFSCCKLELQANRQCGYSTRGPKVTRAEASKRVYTEGCVKTGIAWINANLLTIGGISVGLLVLQIVTLCLAQTFRSQVREVQEFAKRH